MKRLSIALLAMGAAACLGSAPPRAPTCPDAGTAPGVVCEFYARYLELRPSGLPTVEQQAALAPWLSERLEARLAQARRIQSAFRTQSPDEKPPLVDGCLFASLFEGPTDYTVGTAERTGAVTRVPVRFRYHTAAEWEDTVLVTREGDAFVIDDVEFGGAGPFNPPGRLSELLEHAGE